MNGIRPKSHDDNRFLFIIGLTIGTGLIGLFAVCYAAYLPNHISRTQLQVLDFAMIIGGICSLLALLGNTLAFIYILSDRSKKTDQVMAKSVLGARKRWCILAISFVIFALTFVIGVRNKSTHSVQTPPAMFVPSN